MHRATTCEARHASRDTERRAADQIAKRSRTKARRVPVPRSDDRREHVLRQPVGPRDAACEVNDVLTDHFAPSEAVTIRQMLGAVLADKQRERVADLMRELELPLLVEHHDIEAVE